MDRISIEKLKRNAYRVLGLDAGATQPEIEFAARVLRVRDQEMAARDPLLGVIDRRELELERAVTLLMNPDTRCLERVWSFCRTGERGDSEAKEAAAVQAEHDEAVAALCVLLKDSYVLARWKKWEQLLERFAILAKSQAYLQWMQAVESRGEFEKSATQAELELARQRMLEGVAMVVVDIAQEIARKNEVLGAFTLFGSAKRFVPKEVEYNSAAVKVLDRMEWDFMHRCDDMERRLAATQRGGEMQALMNACEGILSGWHLKKEESLMEVKNLSPAGDSRAERMKCRLINFMLVVIRAYAPCNRPELTGRVLMDLR